MVSDWRIGLSFSHSERAPTVNELFSHGPHGGSQQFLVGDPGLSLQKSNGAELSIHRTTGPVHVQASAYYNLYSNYIFEAPTGITYTFSAGVAQARPDEKLDAVLERADRALYVSKERGRDCTSSELMGL